MSNYTIVTSGIKNDWLRRIVICGTFPIMAWMTFLSNAVGLVGILAIICYRGFGLRALVEDARRTW